MTLSLSLSLSLELHTETKLISFTSVSKYILALVELTEYPHKNYPKTTIQTNNNNGNNKNTKNLQFTP